MKTLLHSKNIISKHLEFERQNKKVAIQEFKNKIDKTVISCGLFVDSENSFFGASPDGIIEDDKKNGRS